jgi:probable phosphoglycerate mutase
LIGVPFPEAESWRMLHQRITPFLEKINKTEPNTVLIVSHGNAIEECIFWWLEFALEQRQKCSFVVDPCSITYLRKNDWQQKVVVHANRVNHLQSLFL